MIDELKSILPKEPVKNVYGFNNYYGVRIPELRKIAKKIVKENRLDYLKEKHDSFEELTIHAFVIGYLKEDINTCLRYVKDFIPYIDNWSVNDSLCQNMKFAKKYPKEVFNFLLEMKDSNLEYEIRVIAVTFLSHFLIDEYIDEVIEVLDKLNRPTYMAKMGIAWAYATIMAKYSGKMFNYLPTSSLDDWTYNKMISKMLESFRVDEKDKERLRTMKR